MSHSTKSTFCDFVREHLNSKVTLDEFSKKVVNECDKEFLEEKIVLDIYHALQHFEIDSSDDRAAGLSINALDKLTEVINSFEADSADTEVYLQEFFSLPQ